jgi:ankyrin repeat protein
VRRGQTAVVEYLVERGAGLEESDGDGNTVLMLAVRLNSVEVVRTLLRLGADPNTQNVDKMTALHHAMLSLYNRPSGNNEVAKLLLEAGAGLDAQDKWGNTALHLAARYSWDGEHWPGMLETVRMLVAAGASLRLADREGDTPLMVATGGRGGWRELVRLLTDRQEL